jgi:hypothetical protein
VRMNKNRWLQNAFKNRWLQHALQIIVAVLWLWWWFHVPLPGKALLVLTIVAIFISLVDITAMQRLIWIILVVALAFLENKAINKDRAEFVAAQEKFSNEQKQHFDDIGEGIKTAVTQSQNQFQATMKSTDALLKESKENIDAITGGKTFCYVSALIVGEDEAALAIATVGTSPLHDVNIDAVDLDMKNDLMAKNQPLTIDTIQHFTTSYPAIPFLASTSAHWLTRISLSAVEKRDLHFNFFSMNGVWGETLNLRRVDERWVQAIKVTKEFKPNHQTTIFLQVAPNYPKVNGKVDW